MSINDGIQLEKRGVATANICAGNFARLGQHEAKALGVPSLPIVVIPYPFGSLPDERVRQIAEDIVDEVIYVLTTPRERLEEEYLDGTPPVLGRRLQASPARPWHE
ncbi:MAG: hypothetical protein HYX92_11980 [Chloroflexi bacterium]|nr:hypothetical protein [Chloroflexota bacterium]